MCMYMTKDIQDNRTKNIEMMMTKQNFEYNAI